MEVKIEQWCVWHLFGSVSVVMFIHDSLLLSREKIVVATCYSVHDVQLFTVLTCSWFRCFSGVCLCSLIPQGTGISSSLYPLHGEAGICEAVGLLWLYLAVLDWWVFCDYSKITKVVLSLVSIFLVYLLMLVVHPLLLWHAGIPHLPLDTGQGQDLGALQGASWVSFCWFWQ